MYYSRTAATEGHMAGERAMQQLSAPQQRYAAGRQRVLAALSRLEAMVREYPQPEKARGEGASDELHDLASRLEALTATWSPAGDGRSA